MFLDSYKIMNISQEMEFSFMENLPERQRVKSDADELVHVRDGVTAVVSQRQAHLVNKKTGLKDKQRFQV